MVDGTRVIHMFVQIASVRPSGKDLIGVLMLLMPLSETGKAVKCTSVGGFSEHLGPVGSRRFVELRACTPPHPRETRQQGS